MKTLAISTARGSRSAKPDDLARTQIYLTRQQNQTLAFVCRRTSSSKSEVIRQAIDRFLQDDFVQSKPERTSKLLGLVGLWADRFDTTDPTAYVRQLRAPRF